MPLIAAGADRPVNMQQLVIAIAAAAATLALAACLPSVGGPAAGLALLNPMTVEPGMLRAAVRLPDTVRIIASELTVTADMTGFATPEVRYFPLTVSRDPAERVPLVSETKVGFALTIVRLDAEQAAALASWRRELTLSRRGKLTLAIRVDACREAGAPGDPVPLTFYIAASPSGGYAMLTAETDLARLARTGSPMTLSPCGSS